MKKIIIIVIFLNIFLASCFKQNIFKVKNISEGERIYRSKCGSCHHLFTPREYSDDGWEYAVEFYGEGLTDDEKAKLLNYLKENN